MTASMIYNGIYNGIPARASTRGGAAALLALSGHHLRSIKQAAGASQRSLTGLVRWQRGGAYAWWCRCFCGRGGGSATLVGARAGVLPASEAVVVKSGSKNTVFIPFFSSMITEKTFPESMWTPVKVLSIGILLSIDGLI